MINKTVTFKNFDGEEVTKTYSFHMNKTEMMRWETEGEESIGKKVVDAVNTKNPKGIFEFICELLLRSYGEKSEDGISFVKVKNGIPLRDSFESSLAFDAIIDEFIKDPNKLNAFVEHVFPEEVLKMGAEQMEKEEKEKLALTSRA